MLLSLINNLFGYAFFYFLCVPFFVYSFFESHISKPTINSFHKNNSYYRLLSDSFSSFCIEQKSTVIAPKTKSKKHSDHYIIPWKKENEQISAPPSLMGKQMGVVETPGVPPLGYELDGNIKIFRLIAQPIEHLIVDEKNRR
ncbi:hypothetical protein KC460_02405 [Candidatus Dependentiae bacterium]|nr:hypothetical protein [Candidatus Dependentiae bacterium]